MDTVQNRLRWLLARGRIVWVWLKPRLRWVRDLLFGAIWLAVFLALRVLEASKRVTATALLIALVCLWQVYRVARMDGWLWTMLAALGLGLLLMHGAQIWWVDYRQKLVFLVESHPQARPLHVDGDLYDRLRLSRRPVGYVWMTLAALLALTVAVAAWRAASADFQALVTGTVCAVAGVAFAVLAGLARQVEKLYGVAFFVRGWRLADPLELEAKLLERYPWTAAAIAWRRRVGAVVGRVTPTVVEPIARPYGTCVG